MYYRCLSCSDVFWDTDDRDEHMDENSHWPECETCDCTFDSWGACTRHMDALNHWSPSYECDTCLKEFTSEQACNQHMDALNHWAPSYECETCSKVFSSEHSCNQHMEALDHWAPRFECETCDKAFSSEQACNQHMNALNHWTPRFSCETCTKTFHTENAVNQHMKQLGHWACYCRQCGRAFVDENSLKMHLNSTIHRGRTIMCPFCKTWFTTPSGLSHHLESASCPKASSLNRETIHRMIRERDPKGTITMRQIGWHPELNSTYHATDLAFNGTYWECYMCHGEFRTKGSLNQHLNSPAHKQLLYHCPNYTNQCGRQFPSLGALFNHLESESCAFMRFEKVQSHVENVLAGKGRIAF